MLVTTAFRCLCYYKTAELEVPPLEVARLNLLSDGEVVLRISDRGSFQPSLKASRSGELTPSWGTPSLVAALIATELFLPESSRGQPPSVPRETPLELPISASFRTLCAPPALPVGGLSQITWARERGCACSGGGQLWKLQAPWEEMYKCSGSFILSGF